MKISDHDILLIAGKKQLKNSNYLPLTPIVDLSLSRMYFYSAQDTLYRITLTLIQLLWIVIIFFNGQAVSHIIIENIKLPLSVLQQNLFRILTLVLTTFFSMLVLLMILPLFLAKTIKGVMNTSICYLLFGSLINVILLTISIVLFYIAATPYRALPIPLSVFTFSCWLATLVFWMKHARNKNKLLVKSIIKTYQLHIK